MHTLAGHPGHTKLLRKLATTTQLSTEDEAALLATAVGLRNVAPDEDVVRQGDRPSTCTVILEGFACRYRIEPDGRRQILSFHVPGDMPDVQSLYVESMDHGISALRPTTIATVPHSTVKALMAAHPTLEDALWRETLVDAAIYRQWIFNLGRRTANVRAAHLLSETAARFEDVNMPKEAGSMPLKQLQLADALGLTPVHVNRVLQYLRELGLLGPGRSAIEIRDRDRLAQFGEFEPGYLRLRAA